LGSYHYYNKHKRAERIGKSSPAWYHFFTCGEAWEHMGKAKKLSIVVPCFNEKHTIEAIVDEVLSVNLGTTDKEIIIVDDGSTDGTRTILRKLAKKHTQICVLENTQNMGK